MEGLRIHPFIRLVLHADVDTGVLVLRPVPPAMLVLGDATDARVDLDARSSRIPEKKVVLRRIIGVDASNDSATVEARGDGRLIAPVPSEDLAPKTKGVAPSDGGHRVLVVPPQEGE